jgi:hypothetical protein
MLVRATKGTGTVLQIHVVVGTGAESGNLLELGKSVNSRRNRAG